VYFAAELRILLVYLSESLEKLGQNRGPLGGTFFIGGRGSPPPPPRRTAPDYWSAPILPSFTLVPREFSRT